MRSQVELARALFGLRVEVPRADRMVVPLSAFISAGRHAGVGLVPTDQDERRQIGSFGVGGVRGRPVVGLGVGGGGKRELLPGDFEPDPVDEGPDDGEAEPPEPVVPAEPVPGGGLSVVARRVVAVHVTADTAAGSSTSELRAFGPFGGGFRIRSLAVFPLAGVQVGQYFDVLVSADGDTTDVALATGTSIFRPVLGVPPVPDGTNAGAVPLEALRLTDLFEVLQGGQFIKVVVSFVAPAVALPDVSFVFEIDELSGAASPVTARARPRPRARKMAVGSAGGPSGATVEAVAMPVPPAPAAWAAVLPHAAGASAGGAAAGPAGASYVPAVTYFGLAGNAGLVHYDPQAAALDGAGGLPAPVWFHKG